MANLIEIKNYSYNDKGQILYTHNNSHTAFLYYKSIIHNLLLCFLSMTTCTHTHCTNICFGPDISHARGMAVIAIMIFGLLPHQFNLIIIFFSHKFIKDTKIHRHHKTTAKYIHTLSKTWYYSIKEKLNSFQIEVQIDVPEVLCKSKAFFQLISLQYPSCITRSNKTL